MFFLIAAFSWPEYPRIAPFIAMMGLGAIGVYFATFIDNSNRNWAMHVIDWIEENRGEASETIGDQSNLIPDHLPIVPDSIRGKWPI